MESHSSLLKTEGANEEEPSWNKRLLSQCNNRNDQTKRKILGISSLLFSVSFLNDIRMIESLITFDMTNFPILVQD